MNHSATLYAASILIILTLTACQPASPTALPAEIDRPADEALPPSQEPAETADLPSVDSQDMRPVFPPGDGLTYEELRRTTPPAPVELRSDARQGGIRLDWKTAPFVEIEHTYSDVVLYYNVFRRTGQMVDLEFLGTTEETFYIDQSARPGIRYYYAVSAVHEGPVEGERTDPVEVLP